MWRYRNIKGEPPVEPSSLVEQTGATIPAGISWSVDSVVRKTWKGFVALGVRQFVVQGANVAGGVVLARLLTPAEFGLFGIVVFLQGFLLVFGGTGLAANLIRQHEEPAEEDYRAVFAVQQALVSLLAVALWISSPWISSAYGLPPVDAWMFRLVAISLVVTSFMVVPQVRLERNLDFDKLAVVEIAQALVFNATVVFLAWRGFGGIGFALAILSRSFVGAAAANLVSPWSIRWRWDWSRARRHLRFGLYFQGSQFVSVVKDSITPVFIGLFLGVAQAGYVNWAGMVAVYPVLALMILQRIYMPAFARMQAHTEQLGRFVEQVIWATNALIAPISVIVLVLVEPLTHIVFGEKWLVALPIFYLLWAGGLFAPTATPLMGLLNALGAARTTLAFTSLWMVGTWLLGVPLILLYGSIGYGVASLMVMFSALLLFRVAKSYVSFGILRAVLPSWGMAGGVGLVLALAAAAWPVRTLPALVAYALAGFALYAAVLLVTNRKTFGAFRMLAHGSPDIPNGEAGPDAG